MSAAPPSLSMLRHELRTPLCAVNGYLERVLNEQLPPETARSFLEIALAETRRVWALLDDLAGDRQPRGRTSADVAACAREAFAALRARAAAAGVHVALPPGDGALVAVPPHRLTQMLVDLIENAIEHGARPGRVEIAVIPADGEVRIAVDDDGPGIPPAQRLEVFEAGRRLLPSCRPGSGFGLAFVAWAAAASGGRVSAGQSPLGGARLLLEFASA